MTNLDEAIKHCEEVAETEEQKYKEWKGDYSHLKKIDSCLECASEHRQLADWLKELKGLRENEGVKDVFKNCYTCKYINLNADDYPCDRCMHRYINQYVYDDKREVKADDGYSN